LIRAGVSYWARCPVQSSVVSSSMSDVPVPLIPRSVLLADAHYIGPQISPDGTRLGYLAPRDGVLNGYVGPLSDPAAARPMTNNRGQEIRWYGFCADDRSLYYLQDADGDENWRLYLLDLHSGEQRCVTPLDQVAVQVLERKPA